MLAKRIQHKFVVASTRGLSLRMLILHDMYDICQRISTSVTPRRRTNYDGDDSLPTSSQSPPPGPVLSNDDEYFMQFALAQARESFDIGEVPVGAVLVSPSGDVIARAGNRTEADGDPTAHAEMSCIRRACATSGGWRLLDCTLYITLEPCPMCAGAILQSRVGTVVYGARNVLLGADGSWIHMFATPSSTIAETTQCQKATTAGSQDSDDDCIRDVHEDVQFVEEQQQQQQQQEQQYDSNCRHAVAPHPFHPRLEVRRGVCEDECAQLMKEFFRQRRKQ